MSSDATALDLRSGGPEPDPTPGFVWRARCPLCDATEWQLLWEGRLDREPVRGWIARHAYSRDPVTLLRDPRFALARCPGCDLVHHRRVLDPLGMRALYGAWIDARQIERIERELARDGLAPGPLEQGRQTLKHVLRLHALAGRPETMRLLDFGCGDGRLLSAARGLGFDAWGVDPAETRALRSGERVLGSIAAVAGASGGAPFDAVVAQDVLEHVVHPLAALRELAAQLREGGVALVEVPDARGIAGPPATFEKFRLVHPLEHVNAFTRQTLDRLCALAGLSPVRRPRAHVTTSWGDVVRTALSPLVPLLGTSRYYLKAHGGSARHRA